jgi:hypothetical protein
MFGETGDLRIGLRARPGRGHALLQREAHAGEPRIALGGADRERKMPAPHHRLAVTRAIGIRATEESAEEMRQAGFDLGHREAMHRMHRGRLGHAPHPAIEARGQPVQARLATEAVVERIGGGRSRDGIVHGSHSTNAGQPVCLVGRSRRLRRRKDDARAVG